MSETPELHQSLAHLLISQSPLHCYFKAFREAPEGWSSQRNSGTVLHKLVLGKGKEIVSIDAADWKTKAAREERDAVIAEGKTPELVDKLDSAFELSAHVVKELESRGISLSGESELMVQWQAGPVACAGTLDHWLRKSATIIDLKFTGVSVAPENLGRLMVSTGADIQAAAYRQAMETKYPELAGRITSLYVYVEVDEPHAISVVRPNGEMRKLGESKWARACGIWQDCLEKYGIETPWPGYSTDIVEVAPPAWALAQDMEAWQLMERAEANAA